MILREALAENRVIIAEKWLDSILTSYHEDGARFFKKQKDRFANPLGYNARMGAERTVERLAAGEVSDLPPELVQFIKLRAVQTFKPSEAIGFMYELKQISAKVCGMDLMAANFSEWQAIEADIDKLALQAFDLFMADRELIYKIKLEEFKSGNAGTANGGCPSGAVLRKHNAEKIELKVIRDC
ncbi:MAG: hypothetical protein GXP59_10075 [Deltaproteobacteria bacterium]|nr:hypothetical protein [Deltaproteobacteria bacterium]